MVSIRWAIDDCVDISGKRYLIHSRRTSDGKLNLLDELDNAFITMSDKELVVLWDEGKLRRLADPRETLPEGWREMLERPFNELPSKSREVALWRFPYVKAFIERKLRSRSDAALSKLIEEVAEEEGGSRKPSARQLRRWLADWFAIGAPDLRDVRCIAPRFHLRGNSKERFDPDVDDIVYDTIKELYLTRTPHSGMEIHEEVVRRVQMLPLDGRAKRFLDSDGQLKVHSVRTIYRMLNSIAQDNVIRGQRGPIEADRLCEPVVRGPQGTYSLEEVEIDHTLLDVIVVDKANGIPLGRPWITVVLDRYTRMVLGVYIGFRPPGAETVMLALRHAIQSKEKDAERCAEADYPLLNPWPCCGKPKAIVVDNGQEFHSRAFKEACAALGIDIIYCPVRKPRYKGKVERWFGRLQRQHIHRLPGTTFSNSKQRGDYPSEKMAVLTLTELRASIIKWIVDVYSVSIHRGIRDIPVQRWHECVERNGGPAMPAHIDDLDVLLSHVEMRKLSRRGIELHGLIYNEKTAAMQELISRRDMPPMVKVRVNVQDLGSIEIEDWRTRRFVTVRSTDPEYARGMSLQEHLIVKQKAVENLEKRQRVTMGKLLEAKQMLRDRYRELSKAGKLKSKRLIVAYGDEDEELGAIRCDWADDDTTEVGFAEDPVEPNAPAEVAPKSSKSKRRKPKSAARAAGPAEPLAAPTVEDDDDLKALRERSASLGISARTYG